MMKLKRMGWMGVLVIFVGWAAAQQAGVTNGVAEAELLDGGEGFFSVVARGGALGIALWLALAALSVAGTHWIVDSFLKIKEARLLPVALIAAVRAAVERGELDEARRLCDEEDGALAHIVLAGLEGEETEDAVGIALALESELLMQRVTYLNVVGNLAPMLGLLGTVQGMIMAFATLGTEAGAAKNAMLATNISQALYTTAAGLVIAVPALAFYSFFRNRAAKIMLNMEALAGEILNSVRR